MNQPSHENKIMTLKDVSLFLKIPVPTLYTLVKQGKVRGVKFGRQWRFLEQDILDYFHGKRPSYVS